LVDAFLAATYGSTRNAMEHLRGDHLPVVVEREVLRHALGCAIDVRRRDDGKFPTTVSF